MLSSLRYDSCRVRKLSGYQNEFVTVKPTRMPSESSELRDHILITSVPVINIVVVSDDKRIRS